MRRKSLLVFACVTAITIMSAVPAMAGEWKQSENKWRYQNDNGSDSVSQWQAIDGSWYYFGQDGTMSVNCWVGNYYVGPDGAMLVNTTTPDGFKVGADGVWINETKPATSHAGTSTPATVKGPGTYKVGTDIEAGEYVLFSQNRTTSKYFIRSDNSDSSNSFIAADSFDYNAIVTVNEGEYLYLTDCTMSPIGEVPQIDISKATELKVGYHIPAGRYKLTSNEILPYYKILSSSRDTLLNTVKNDFFEGETYVDLTDGQCLILNRCRLEL